MSADVIIVTCSEPDALPFLLSLPDADLKRVTLVATGDVVRSAERQTQVAATSVINGLAAVDEVRRLTGDAQCRVAVIVAPDPWGPINGKGFVRARLLAPWFIGPGARADLMELCSGGRVLRTRSGLARRALMLRLYARETLLLAEYVVQVGVGRPVGRLATQAGRPVGRLGTLLSLPRAVIGAALAIPVAAVTLARLIPFILWTEARARMKERRL
jgi:hypothetical protein